MSEVEQQVIAGPGNTLKTARETRGLSLKEAAERLRLTPQVIIDLEADDYTNLAKVIPVDTCVLMRSFCS